ncbi:MAG TPA: YigZ family protein [Phaeodactylibacter sp.]|nr:YigZ family protein [Phaeodactylibacter sp.]
MENCPLKNRPLNCPYLHPMKDSYRTIAQNSTGEFKDRGSKFIAYAFPCASEEDFQTQLQKVKQEHFKARHHCYAYRIGLDSNRFRANDDGEPSGTAGKPILGQIDKLQLTYLGIIVVRYFGGTKLGTSGLINAYREAAKAALAKASFSNKIVEDVYTIQFDYALMSTVMNAIKKLELNIEKQDFTHTATIHLAIRQSEVQDKIKRLKAYILNIHLEEVEAIEQTDGFEISFSHTK